MNILLFLSIASLTFLSPHSLLAEHIDNQAENNSLKNRLGEARKLGCDVVPTSNLLSSISYLDITPKLMMDPITLEEGTKAVGEALGILEKKAVIAEKSGAESISIPSN